MTSRTAAFAATLGACCGLAGGLVGGFLVARDPGPGAGAPGTVRGDLDRVLTATIENTQARADVATALTALAARVDAIERRGAGASGGANDASAAIAAIAEDVRRLRDASARDASAAELRLRTLELRVAELASIAMLSGSPGAQDGPPEEEGVWVTLARDHPDPARRFSALHVLGRARTDRSVDASVRALRDPDEMVVWEALQNVGRFEVRAAARDVAALLDDDRVTIRSAAHETLRRLGAPDKGFDPAALAERRRPPAEALRAWAEQAE